MDRKTYTVGQMAELCNISKKQLRYYDKIDILSPNYRDASTNYRYYTDDQIEEILLLKELRKLGIPLETIGNLLKNRNLVQIQTILEQYLAVLRKELQARHQQYDQIVDTLLGLIQSSSLAGGHAEHQEIKIVTFPQKSVVYTRYVSPWNACQLYPARRAEVLKLAETCHQQVAGPIYAVFHSGYMGQFSEKPQDSQGDLEICACVPHVNGKAGDGFIRTIPSFPAISSLHIGHYKYMQNVYLKMEEWARRNAIAIENKSIEEYLVGPTIASNSDDYVTKIYIPLKNHSI